MSAARKASKPFLAAIHQSKIVGVRAGTEHRFTGTWVVVVNGRVFVRSWNDKPTGWRRAFESERGGALQIPGDREIRVRARRVRGERLLQAIDEAYAEKYNTPASQKWVRGLARGKRRLNTMELIPQ